MSTPFTIGDGEGSTSDLANDFDGDWTITVPHQATGEPETVAITSVMGRLKDRHDCGEHITAAVTHDDTIVQQCECGWSHEVPAVAKDCESCGGTGQDPDIDRVKSCVECGGYGAVVAPGSE